MTVFVVDDDAGARRFMTCLLTSWTRHQVFDFESAEDALVRLYIRPPAVLLTDLNLPGISGEGLARLASHLPAPPRIILTSGDAKRLEAARVVSPNLLRKPFSIQELLFFFQERSEDS